MLPAEPSFSPSPAGKFQFEEMQQVSRLVPIMFFVFVLFNSWVLINLLLTLIIRTFTQVCITTCHQHTTGFIDAIK